ncbi:hypothetical protein UFOVP698_11 [uncultured Caudovirales phage]|uniref:Uncharacterized protein n=1 Tax=uncultured Caudovirales phage TaxID=2100421 RepID=A0A6J5NN74_9CAUD|nr:hypothetical protein UFOVP698_11 [uncultured Caudovirales phage]
MKPLNCMCAQCKAHSKRKALYLVEVRKARRITKAALSQALRQRDYDIDIPSKTRGEHAA